MSIAHTACQSQDGIAFGGTIHLSGQEMRPELSKGCTKEAMDSQCEDKD